jgi:prepilin-type processing-associated H-X9-DG protein
MASGRGTWFLIAIGVFVAAPIALLVGSMIEHQATQAARRANLIQSGLDLRTIGQAIRFYADNDHGEYPDSFQSLLLKEDVSAEEFASPARLETPATGPTSRAVAGELIAGGHLSYVYVGRGLCANLVTPETVVAYEIPIESGDGTNVLFGDGHTEFVDGTVASKVIAREAAGRFPVTRPSP